MTASDLRNLDRDLPTTAEDVEALRRARRDSRMSPQQISDAVQQLGWPTPAQLRARPLSKGEPFTLHEGD